MIHAAHFLSSSLASTSRVFGFALYTSTFLYIKVQKTAKLKQEKSSLTNLARKNSIKPLECQAFFGKNFAQILILRKTFLFLLLLTLFALVFAVLLFYRPCFWLRFVILLSLQAPPACSRRFACVTIIPQSAAKVN
jgi:hypothetical protein